MPQTVKIVILRIIHVVFSRRSLFLHPMLKLDHCSYSVSDSFKLEDLHFTIDQGQLVGVIGDSGCGKTTLLKLVYGLLDSDSGTLYWKDTPIQGPKFHLVPGMPFIKYLSQDFDLMPYISVAENVKKYLSRFEPEASTQRCNELLEVVDMSAFAQAKVKTLSGGQKQRVALAQVLAKEPELLLLDEPFSHIDNFRKNKLRRQLFGYLKQQNITAIVATHDATDVLSYLDETIVLRSGAIVTNAPTKQLYDNPPSYYVASLFGEVNEIPAQWFDDTASEEASLLVYPHQLEVTEIGLQVIVTNCYFKGDHYLVEAEKEGISVFFLAKQELGYGDLVSLKRKK